jgi:antitoxin PrlF
MGYNAKVTSKGQITLPAEMRKSLNLQAGDRVTFAQDAQGRYYVEARTGTLADLRGIVKAERIKAADLDDWIEEARGRRASAVRAPRKTARRSER